jgi:hypothetical protein
VTFLRLLKKTRHYETGSTAWILSAAIQSAAIIGIVWLAQIAMGTSPLRPAMLAAFAEFLTIKLPLYLFIARDLCRWRGGRIFLEIGVGRGVSYGWSKSGFAYPFARD